MEKRARTRLQQLLVASPIPSGEILEHIHLYVRPQQFGDVLCLADLYRKILTIPGIVIEFGVRFGRRLSILHALRCLYEPFNHQRRIVGFDTFSGFMSPHAKDGKAKIVQEGRFDVPPGYVEHLREVLAAQSSQSILSHLEMIRIIEGDASVRFPEFLAERPETAVALAYFDMDLYEPTRICLEAIESHLVDGSILVFDEFAHPEFPGEAQAVREFFAGRSLRLRKIPGFPHPTYVKWRL